MTSLVLDASATLPWFARDEATEASDELFRRVMREGAAVTAYWAYEVANAFLAAERHDRMKTGQVDDALAELADMPITAQDSNALLAWTQGLPVARMARLSVYDGGYLALAYQTQVPIATRDKALARASREHGLVVLDC